MKKSLDSHEHIGSKRFFHDSKRLKEKRQAVYLMANKDIWLSGEKRETVLEDPKTGLKKAFFGYDAVSEEEKTHRVLKHFNSVADWYDFMNTLLSFGIHYLWKRTAVRTMRDRKSVV